MPRSRGGCANCRKRKRKCDERRPTCLACQTRGTDCGGYNLKLQWGNGVASRGYLTGAAIPVKNHGVSISELGRQTSPASESFLEYGGDLFSPNDIFKVTSPTTFENATALDSGTSFKAALSTEDEQVLQRFFDLGVSTLYSTRTNDWIKQGMRTMSEESESLKAACIALQLFLEQHTSENFHNHFERALQVFQHELKSVQGVPKGGTICAGLLLCTISFTMGMRWTIHLSCMADLYQLRGSLDHLDPHTDRYQHHCLEVMGLMDSPLLVLGRINSSLNIWTRFRKVQMSWTYGTEGGVEVVSGYPRTLLDLIARIDEPGIEVELYLWHGEIGELLQAHLWDASRFAAMLLARRRRGFRITRRVEDCIHLPSTAYLLWRVIAALESLGHGIEQPKYKHMLVSNATLFPIMAASLECILLRANPSWKQTLDCFSEKIRVSDISCNTRTFFEILDEAWESEREDFDIDQASIQRGVEIALF